MGEPVAWVIGCDLILELALGARTAVIVLILTAVLCLGIKVSSRVNFVMVVSKSASCFS